MKIQKLITGAVILAASNALANKNAPEVQLTGTFDKCAQVGAVNGAVLRDENGAILRDENGNIKGYQCDNKSKYFIAENFETISSEEIDAAASGQEAKFRSFDIASKTLIEKFKSCAYESITANINGSIFTDFDQSLLDSKVRPEFKRLYGFINAGHNQQEYPFQFYFMDIKSRGSTESKFSGLSSHFLLAAGEQFQGYHRYLAYRQKDPLIVSQGDFLNYQILSDSTSQMQDGIGLAINWNLTEDEKFEINYLETVDEGNHVALQNQINKRESTRSSTTSDRYLHGSGFEKYIKIPGFTTNQLRNEIENRINLKQGSLENQNKLKNIAWYNYSGNIERALTPYLYYYRDLIINELDIISKSSNELHEDALKLKVNTLELNKPFKNPNQTFGSEFFRQIATLSNNSQYKFSMDCEYNFNGRNNLVYCGFFENHTDDQQITTRELTAKTYGPLKNFNESVTKCAKKLTN